MSIEDLAQFRGVQGYRECEIFENGLEDCEVTESASASRWDRCNKNPGHKQFLTSQHFSLNDLPSRTSDECYRRLKSLSDLVVRIRVQWTSTHRPETDNLAHLRGSRRLRLGSGIISYISESKEGDRCPCKSCHGEAVCKHWKFTVHTARHVVFDTEEACRAKVDLFYDDAQGGKEDGRGRMQTAQAVKLQYAATDTTDKIR